MNGRELLRDYIAKNTTPAQFARDSGCSASHLSLILKGERGISFKTARRIAAATNGAIPLDKLDIQREQEAAQ